jgi:hypothetical protein
MSSIRQPSRLQMVPEGPQPAPHRAENYSQTLKPGDDGLTNRHDATTRCNNNEVSRHISTMSRDFTIVASEVSGSNT